tara:strand:+ start:2942 stop:3148 length:207 start_codon:yes stop_codon:yes gene_type:complete
MLEALVKTLGNDFVSINTIIHLVICRLVLGKFSINQRIGLTLGWSVLRFAKTQIEWNMKNTGLKPFQM